MHLSESLIIDIPYSIIVMKIISKMQKIILQNCSDHKQELNKNKMLDIYYHTLTLFLKYCRWKEDENFSVIHCK